MAKNSRLVFSTDSGRIKPAAGDAKTDTAGADAGDGWVRLYRESKGRAGKAVCLIDGIAEDQQKLICKRLKQNLGCGGSVKEGRIEIQGDRRAQIKEWLEKQDFRVKISGG